MQAMRSTSLALPVYWQNEEVSIHLSVWGGVSTSEVEEKRLSIDSTLRSARCTERGQKTSAEGLV